eukprot:ANDGO_08621.mRNA.1 WAT1-related protein At3g18200
MNAFCLQRRDIILSSVLLVFNQLIWAIYYVLSSIALKGYEYPVLFVALRIWMSIVPMGVLAAVFDKKRIIPPRRCIKDLILLGLITGSGSQLMFLVGLYFSNAIIAALAVPTTPALVSFVAILTKKERFTWIKGVGILCTVVGCFVVILLRPFFSDNNANSPSEGRNVPLGATLCFSTIILNVWSVFLQKSVSAHMPVLSVNANFFVYGCLFISIFLGIDVLFVEPGMDLGVALSTMPLIVWGTILFAVFVGSTIGYILFSVALKRSSPLFVSSFQPLQPIFATCASWIAFGGTPLISDLIGGVLILSGLALVLYAKSKETPVHIEESFKHDGLADSEDNLEMRTFQALEDDSVEPEFEEFRYRNQPEREPEE